MYTVQTLYSGKQGNAPNLGRQWMFDDIDDANDKAIELVLELNPRNDDDLEFHFSCQECYEDKSGKWSVVVGMIE